ncbi:MAG: DUF1080 domain-containing protein [Pirellulales bacterium]
MILQTGSWRATWFWMGLFCIWTLLPAATSSGADPAPENPLVGRWDLTVQSPDGAHPSWLEVRQSGASLVGSFVGQFGSARPVGFVRLNGQEFRFQIPPQYEKRTSDLVFEGKVDGDKLSGDTTDPSGKTIKWTGTRAPKLARDGEPKWGEPIELFNGKDLDGWKPMMVNVPSGWVARDGLLANDHPGNNLMTERKFEDFKLHAEFRYPKGSNGGIYLRGRYEVQIEDNFGGEPDSHRIGGVYGFLTPSINAAKPAGEWQTVDIELVGRVVTVVLNGERVIDRQTIPGITGGALDSEEGSAGPIYLQGDHGPLEFRRLTLTPALP